MDMSEIRFIRKKRSIISRRLVFRYIFTISDPDPGVHQVLRRGQKVRVPSGVLRTLRGLLPPPGHHLPLKHHLLRVEETRRKPEYRLGIRYHELFRQVSQQSQGCQDQNARLELIFVFMFNFILKKQKIKTGFL